MGVIAIPASGLAYLDANAIIYSVERHPTYWPLVEPVWLAAKAKMQAGCAIFVTNDGRFRNIAGLNATILDDLLTP